MIVVLHLDANLKAGEQIVRDLRDAFKGHIEAVTKNASAPTAWPRDANWDDLLIVVYDGTRFPDAGNDFIGEYLRNRDGKGALLPVALDSGHKTPPKAAAAFKALEYDGPATGVNGRLVRRAGSMLGLRLLPHETQVFISYRTDDGAAIAQQLEEHLLRIGYPVWRDEAKEIDGETKILPGSDVQKEIDEGLQRASIVLLLDTPEAPNSRWITHEVDTANAQLLPILPLCFRTEDDHKKGPRFRSLLDLQRWVSLPLKDPLRTPPLTEDEVVRIVSEMEMYLCEIFQRKCRVPFIVEKEFRTRDYSWELLDQRMLMAESVKKHSLRLTTKVLSHCSVFDQVHGHALDAFEAFLKRAGRPNYALYIYDGELIPEPQLKAIIEANPPENGIIILHHQELAALIDSNFSTFPP